MEGFMILGLDIILPGWRCPYKPEVGVSTPCWLVSTRRITAFVPGLLELQLEGRISDPGMICYPPRLAVALRTSASV